MKAFDSVRRETAFRFLCGAFLLLLVPQLGHATPRYEPELSLSIDRARTDPEYKGGGHAPTLVFVGDAPTVKVELHYIQGDEVSGTQHGRQPEVPDYVLPVSNWDSLISLTLRDTNGGSPVGSVFTPLKQGWSRRVSNRESSEREFRLVNGEGVYATYRLAGLPPGDFELRATLRIRDHIVSEATIRIASRSGTESPAIRKAYLHDRADRATTFEEFRRISLQLADENPNEFFALEQLADRSIGQVASSETKGYYRRARDARQRGLEAYRKEHGGDVPASMEALVANDLERLSVFERVAPTLERLSAKVALTPTYRGGRKWFAWTDKRTGMPIEDVDLSRPDSFRSRLP